MPLLASGALAMDGVEGVAAVLGVLRAQQFIGGGEAAGGHHLESLSLGRQRQCAEVASRRPLHHLPARVGTAIQRQG